MPAWPPGDNSKFTIIIFSVRLILTALSFALFAISARVWGFGGEAAAACLRRAAAAAATVAAFGEGTMVAAAMEMVVAAMEVVAMAKEEVEMVVVVMDFCSWEQAVGCR